MLSPVDSELSNVEVDVDSETTLLMVVLNPVDREFTPIDSELSAVEVELDSEATLLFVVLRPVESELMPVEADVDRLAIPDKVVLAAA
ncbi:hypothetical protein SAMN05421548_13933 [Paraburkholderia lycopersici]|uniref:Uncharacterized protein n=1 Tax=Paraburkholderia lycopersici TaxID=416944 RepID=A0A1G7BI39_9BURK|nr:hypothetical protein SAMN05421548_13933 [Paraburkholderia lycopersici]